MCPDMIIGRDNSRSKNAQIKLTSKEASPAFSGARTQSDFEIFLILRLILFIIFQEGRTSSPSSLSGPPIVAPRPESDLMDTKFPLPGPEHYLDQHRNNILLPLPTKTEVK